MIDVEVNTQQFLTELRLATMKAEMKLERMISGAGVDAGSNTIKDTPRARPELWKQPRAHKPGNLANSWRFGLNQTKDSYTYRPDASASAAYNSLRTFKRFKLKDIMNFINPAPYADRVENQGWSRQAPSGMLKHNLDKFEAFLKVHAMRNKI